MQDKLEICGVGETRVLGLEVGGRMLSWVEWRKVLAFMRLYAYCLLSSFL